MNTPKLLHCWSKVVSASLLGRNLDCSAHSLTPPGKMWRLPPFSRQAVLGRWDDEHVTPQTGWKSADPPVGSRWLDEKVRERWLLRRSQGRQGRSTQETGKMETAQGNYRSRNPLCGSWRLNCVSQRNAAPGVVDAFAGITFPAT